MTHPNPDANPHAGVFPDLSADADGVVLTGRTDDGDPITVHTTGGEQPSAPTGTTAQEQQGGTEPSPSSDSPEKSDSSGGKPSPKPARTTESPSEQDQTPSSTAPSADGDGTAPQTTPTRQSGKAKGSKGA